MYLYGLYEKQRVDGFFLKLEDVKRIEYTKSYEKSGGRLLLKDGNVISFKELETAGGAEIAIKKMKELVESEMEKNIELRRKY